MDQIQIVSTKPMSFDTPCQANDLPKEETVIIGDKNLTSLEVKQLAL